MEGVVAVGVAALAASGGPGAVVTDPKVPCFGGLFFSSSRSDGIEVAMLSRRGISASWSISGDCSSLGALSTIFACSSLSLDIISRVNLGF